MGVKKINISMTEDLLVELDAAAQQEYVTRSAFIREAVALRIRLDSYIDQEFKDQRSDFNILKAIHLKNGVRRSINRYRPQAD
jgi:metal-responsive CopG/Arc/MetJ family transcriptional regulator